MCASLPLVDFTNQILDEIHIRGEHALILLSDHRIITQTYKDMFICFEQPKDELGDNWIMGQYFSPTQ